VITGYLCAVCHAAVDVGTAFPWRCPNATAADPLHVLHLVDDDVLGEGSDDANPIVRYRRRCAWWAFAIRAGLTDAECVDLAGGVARGFHITPFGPSLELTDATGLDLWVKDETGNVAGSHKARHLVGILLHLLVAERVGLLDRRPPLAIASCGNAAIAAATLAAGVDWPLDVYVPTWMSGAVGDVLDRLGARTHRCERRPSDPAGDPAMLRFREAVAAGAVPFSVQGPENGLCLDTGRTLGWELGEQIAGRPGSWRIFVQVGGGAFAACVGRGLGPSVRLDTVQAEGCAPLAATWERLTMIDRPERYWAQVMRPWPDPHSLADGILDDETYDWIADVSVMAESGGHPVVAAEADIVRAHDLAVAAGFPVSATGSAGLAGVLAEHDRIPAGDHVIVIMSGVSRS
jgi:cysteine synthase